MVTLALGDRVRQGTDLYRAEWQGAADAIPLMGASRHVVVADSDEAGAGARPPGLRALAPLDGQAVGRARHRLSARRPLAARMGRGRGEAMAAPVRPPRYGGSSSASRPRAGSATSSRRWRSAISRWRR